MKVSKLHGKIVIFFAVVAGLSLSIFPQNPRIETKIWKDKKIRAELQLTDNQVKQMEKIMGEYRDRLYSLSQELKAKQKERQELGKGSPNPDRNRYRQLIQQIYALRNELDRVYMTFNIKMGEVLTPEQKAKLLKMEAQKDPGPSQRPVKR